jgi:16S rRNA (uracil1498-N3)-methyltransferase
MPHFYVPPEAVQGERFVLEKEESRHLAKVLRKKPGDPVTLFDGQGRSYEGRIEKVFLDRVQGRILSQGPASDVPWNLRLFQGFPKGDKFDWLLEKMTELGASEIIPVYTERSVPRIPAERLAGRMKRWKKILLAAAKQSGRMRVPGVSLPLPFAEALGLCGHDALILLPWEEEVGTSLQKVLRSVSRAPGKEINVLIGPEGGFSSGEVQLARGKGAVPVSLGPLTLRTETAGLAVAAALLYEWGGPAS